MFKIRNNTAPSVFQAYFSEIQHPYPTRFSENNFTETKIILNQTKFAVSSRGSRLWNKLLNRHQKLIANEVTYKQSIKSTLLSLENEIRFC